jgi:uncharacterized protein DUF6766
MRFLRDNSLSIVFLVIFLASLAGQAIAGHGQFNHDQLLHHGDPISLGRYLTTSQFAGDVAENWQSEYLQFTLYIIGTVWLLQRGSPESKPLDKPGRESDEDQRIGPYADERSPGWARTGGLRTALYSNSLLIVMTSIWLGSWFAQSFAGVAAYNADQLDHQAATVSWLGYVGSSDFWDRTLQNWQSEFLAVGSMAILSVYLRQRGSPESKPVGAPHGATGIEGG